MRTLMLIAAVTLAATLPGCQREGPAEKAGRQVDRATDKAARGVEKAGQDLRDAVGGKK